MPASIITTAWRKFIDVNRRCSHWETECAARFMSRSSGMNEFWRYIVPGLLRPNLRILDVGGGHSPLISPDTARQLNLHVVGLDISQAELLAAPPGSYAEMIVGDVTDVKIPGPFDLIFSQAVLEHVRDTQRALANLTAALADGATMAHFIPCRRAPFAVCNRLLGNAMAKRILFSIYPERRRMAGFPAYYDCCVPAQFEHICTQCGLKIIALESYFVSDYLQFFAPAHALDLLRQWGMYRLQARNWAESMVLVASKPARSQPHLSPALPLQTVDARA